MRRWLIRIGLVLLALPLILVAAAWVLVDTSFVRTLIAGQVVEATAGGPVAVEIGGLEPGLPGAIVISDLRLSDTEGVFATAARVTLDWSPLDLLFGRAMVQLAEIQDARLERLPVTPDDPETAEPVSEEPFSLAFPAPPVGIRMERFSLDALTLAPGIAGFGATVAADLAADVDGERAALNGRLTIVRADGDAPGEIRLDLVVDPATGTLRAEIEATEPAGGLVASLADIPGRPALDLSLRGEGTLTDWSGRLQGGFGVGARADLEISVTGRDGDLALAVTGQAEPALLVPDAVRPLLGDSVPVDLQATLREDGAIEVTDLTLRPALGVATATARLSADGEPVAATLDLSLPDLAPLSDQAGLPLAGNTRLRLVLDQDGRRARLTVTGRPVADGQPVDDLDLAIEATADRALASLPADVRITVEGGAGMPRLPDLDLATLVGPRIDLNAAADLDLERFAADVSSLTVRTALANLDFAGRITQEGAATGRLTLDIVDLTRLEPVTGQVVSGRAILVSDIDGTAEPLALQAAVGLTTSGIATAIAEADAVLGSAPSLDFGLTVRDRDGLTVDVAGLDLQAALASLRGDATLALDQGALGGRLDVAVPDLAPIGSAAGSPLAGAAAVAVALGGTLEQPAASASWRLSRLVAGGTPIGEVTGSATGGDLTGAPTGTVQLRVVPARLGDGRPLELDTGYALAGDRLTLDDLRLRGLGVSATGGLAADLSGPVADGDLAIAVTDLGRLGRAFAAPVEGGRADLRLTLTPDSEQSARLSGTVEQLRIAGESPVTVDRLEMSADLQSLLGAPSGTARLRAISIGLDAARIEQATVEARSSGDRAEATLTVSGTAEDRPVSLGLDLSARPTGTPMPVTVSRLEAALGDLQARLTRPLNLTLGDAVTFDGLDLDLAGGRVTGQGRLDPARLDVAVALRDLPASLASQGDPSLALDGTLDGDLALSGAIENPKADLRLATDGIRSLNPDYADAPPLIATLEAGLAEREVSVDADLSVGEGASARARGSLRLAAGGAGAPPAFDPAGEVNARLTAQLDLGRFAGFLPLDEGDIQGTFEADVSVTGTGADPKVTGTAELREGRVEHPTFGIAYEQAVARAVGRDAALVIESLGAKSISGGEISGSGQISLDIDDGAPVDIRVRAERFTAVDMDEATVTLSSDLALTGQLPVYDLSGTVTVEPSEIRIPSELSSSVATLDVVEINSETGETFTEEPEEESGDGIANAPLELDIRIDIPGNVFVRGRGLASEWAGGLTVTGRADEPVVAGEVAVRRGSLDAVGQVFDFSRGVVDFDGAPPDNPTLDMVFETDVADITAYVKVSGGAQDPQISIESEPPYPREEILSRLLFGQARAELTPVQALKLARSASILSGGLGSGPGITDQVRDMLGVDTIDVDTGDVANDAAGASLSVGKYITEGVFLRLQQGLNSADSKAVVEVEVTDTISVETDVGADSSSRAGVNWTLDY